MSLSRNNFLVIMNLIKRKSNNITEKLKKVARETVE